jgi:hypothetical protein
VTDSTPGSSTVPNGGGASSRASIDLLDGGALTLRVHRSLAGAADGWIPLDARPTPPGAPRAARMRLVPGRARPFDLPAGEPAVEMLEVRGWADEAAARWRLATPDGGLWGSVDLARRRAVVALRHGTVPREPGLSLYGALTVSAALLLGRLGRAFLHAAAVVGPDGRAWLLVGDSRSGKTSTCVNLIRAGWDWLADDHVVARVDAASGEVIVEGWPRPFNLDEGFTAGRSLGPRAPTDPARFGPGRRRRAAPLGGVLLPRVRADQPSRLQPAQPAAVLSELVRQSPWLLADPHAAPGVLGLLTQMAKTPGFHLSLGADVYAHPRLLQVTVAEALPDPDGPVEGGKRA